MNGGNSTRVELVFYVVQGRAYSSFHEVLCYRPQVNHLISIVSSNHDPLDLIETDLIAPAIVELRCARRGVICHRGSLFQRAAVPEIGRDPGCSEAVIAELRSDAGGSGAPADHRIRVRLRQHRARELAGAAADCSEKRPLGIIAQPHAV